MITLNQYTINTGHLLESTVTDTDKEIYFTMRSVIERAKKERIKFLDDTFLEITEEPLGYVATLYGLYQDNLLPILSTAGTKKEEARFYIWDCIQDTAKAEFGNAFTPHVPVKVPYIVDLIHSTAPFFANIFTWTGSFSRCLGWMMLYPKELQRIIK